MEYNYSYGTDIPHIIETDIYKVMSRYSRIRGLKIPYLIQHSLIKQLEII